ncbi:MAG TPA: FAD-dependent oxidoreductase [Methylocystis sp.]
MKKEHLVIIGAGMAATRLVGELVARAPARYEITLIGEEQALPYNRVLLSSVLAKEASLDDVVLKPAQWWRDAGVTRIAGRKALRIEPGTRRVILAGGEALSYSKLVLATGSRAATLPVEGIDLPGVHAFRDLDDVRALGALGSARRRVVTIGGGLLGLEAAYGLARLGAESMLLHVVDRLMERHLDAEGAALLRRLVEEKGVRVRLGVQTTRIFGRDRVEGVECADGRLVQADAVVFAVGIRPNAELAGEAGLDVGRGVVVDDGLMSNDPNIFAIGECAEHRGQCYGLVAPAYEQARVLAARLAGAEAVYEGSVVSTNLKVSGVRVFSAGDYLGGAAASRIVCSDSRMGVYRKLVTEGDRLTGAILIGDTSGAQGYLELIRTGADVSAMRNELMFDISSLKEAA